MLQNLYWKRDGCASCKGNQNFVCLNKQDCAIRTPSCKGLGRFGWIAVSGFGWHFLALISTWRFSTRGMKSRILSSIFLYGLYSNLKSSLTN
ncbi:unnamed protein product [Arabidopsis halleri]